MFGSDRQRVRFSSLGPSQRFYEPASERLSLDSEWRVCSDFDKEKRIAFLDTRTQRLGRLDR